VLDCKTCGYSRGYQLIVPGALLNPIIAHRLAWLLRRLRKRAAAADLEAVLEAASPRWEQHSEKDTKLVQKLGHLQPFLAVLVFPQKCVGQLAYFGPN
jgi:hypothetical protein